MTEQEKEIQTIKERTIKLKLSDADVERVFEKAGSVGLSVEELLQNFIGDLVDGTYSNGSDERMYANEWLDRCWFKMFPEKTFIKYLLDDYKLDDTINMLDEINDCKECLNDEEELAAMDDDSIACVKDELAGLEEELNDLFNDYKAHGGRAESLEIAISEVIKWQEAKNQMLSC
jgi:hypothetical protein